ncbi:MAG: PadR family transcriptional regulator [Anaerolineae bacterium]|nr:PadR family transcriptional regulator [Anaerolineae bacterium]
MERELLLLGLLRQHATHGYELSAFVEGAMNACVDLKKSTAYFLLDKMAATGWVIVQETREGNRPPRKTYTLTAAGEAEFQRLLRQNLASFNLPKLSNDIGIAFIDTLSQDEAIALLQQRRKHLLSQINQTQHTPKHAGSLQLLIEHQIYVLNSELAWLDTVILRIIAQTKPPIGAE